MKPSHEYWAGYLDGEGCFRLIGGGSPRIEVTSCHKRTLELLRDTFGGAVATAKRPSAPFHHKPAWRWQIGGVWALEVMNAVCKHSVEKAEQIELILDYRLKHKRNLEGTMKKLSELKREHSV